MPIASTRFAPRFVAWCSLMGWLVAALASGPGLASAATTSAKRATRVKPSATAKSGSSSPASRTKVAAKSTKATATAAKKPTVSRRTRLARARAAQYAREMRELAQPRYKVDGTGQLVPDVRAEAAIVYNPVTQEVLYSTNENVERSIASITKVMTTVVFLENEYDMTRQVLVDPADLRGASITYLRRGDRLTVGDLLHLTLIASDNAAARTLARASLLGPQDFIARMNAKAVELGLTSTHYFDPSGLDSNNVSSAFDMARLIAFAASDERISPIMQKATYSFSTGRRTISVRSTNRLLGTDLEVQGGKTGFIRKSGYCLAALFRLPSHDPIAVVVLGAKSSAARFAEARHLFNWLSAKTGPVVATAASSLSSHE
ncbi:MAG: D-alanyl-D-alanine carboxypeptidase family protein [Vicinamibacterales bacterium]